MLCLFLMTIASALVAAAPARGAESGIDFTCATPTRAPNPTICLPDGLGEDVPAPLANGDGPILYAALVTNNGPDVADASAVVTLPDGLLSPGDDMVRRVELPIPFDGDDSDFLGRPLPCARSDADATITCRTGAIAHGEKILILVGVEVSPTAKVGSSATFGVALGPVAPDAYPTTSVQGTIDILGTAHLQASVDPDNVTVVIGHSVTLRVRVHNSGTEEAADAIAFGLLFPRHERNPFKTHFEITNAPDLGDGGVTFVGIASPASQATPAGQLRAGVAQTEQHDAQARLQAETGAGPADAGSSGSPSATPSATSKRGSGMPFALWPLGTIAAGATVTVPVRVAAVRAGTDDFLFTVDSDSDDPACNGGTGVCEEDTSATLRAIVAPASTPSATPTPPSAAGRGGRITDTGSPVALPALELGLLALVVGSALTFAGRTRHPVSPHRR